MASVCKNDDTLFLFDVDGTLTKARQVCYLGLFVPDHRCAFNIT